MEDYFFIVIIFLIFLHLLLAFVKTHKKAKKLPPGPWKLPIIGNLHQIGISRPYITLKGLSEKYGPLMHLKLGERSTIVISSYKILKELMKTSDAALSHRPELLVSKTVAYNGGDIAFAPYGDYWKQMRKICLSELLSTKRINSNYPLMEEEISLLMKSIKESSIEGTLINVYECLNSLTCAIICKATVGTTCNDSDSLMSRIRKIIPLVGLFNMLDLFPSLEFLDKFFPGSNQKLLKMHHEFIDCLLEDIVHEHEESIRKNNVDGEDLLHLLLRLREKESHNFQIPITRDNIKATVLDMFFGGTDTTSILVEWAMAELLKNPIMMKKAQFEVRETFKGKKSVDHNDVQNLKYLKLVVKETLRLHPPGPLAAPRESTEEIAINGYIIPNKTIFLMNLYAMGRDPEYWRDPDKFMPDRFNNYVDKDVGDVKMIKGSSSVPMEFLGFGFGKRVCPGMLFATASSELTLARFLYHFDWKLPNGMNPEDLDMTESFGAAATRKNTLYLVATPYD
ncbi:premnaspirodiene oxygenase-like [Solanum dulcamara]|uniref:premnaspirodiene oxygenase-like n=1 Tax=Solanum dulcamara TaxID=45834 RepID=UPI0024855ED8|nr:premnaspirodiene oxygenase-like [Solanum dulcamara]